MSFQITVREVKDVTIGDASGRLVIGYATHSLKDWVSNCIALKYKKIILNLSDVTYIDASGIAELTWTHTRFINAGANLCLLGLNKRIVDLLRITKLFTVFTVCENEEEAIRIL